jgi:hypothetical protein
VNLSKPNRSTVDTDDAGARLLSQLIEFYDALIDLGRPILPSRAPNLKSITLETLADLRKTVGDDQGEKGPRSLILAGGTANLDALTGVWVWDSLSTLADNGTTVIQVTGIAVGRWRKIGSGANNGTTWINFTKDLGVGALSGTFDLTGLSGLSPGANVAVIQTAQPITSKGNARDEFEMDPIVATGYVVDASTIRVYWSAAPSVVVGTYAFAYSVGT